MDIRSYPTESSNPNLPPKAKVFLCAEVCKPDADETYTYYITRDGSMWKVSDKSIGWNLRMPVYNSEMSRMTGDTPHTIEARFKAWKREEPFLSVYDLLPDFGSYLADVESNLRYDPETWRKYERNPVPFLTDVLCDFGTFPEGLGYDKIRNVARRAAKDWAGK